MRVITAYPTTCAPSCIGIRFPTHRQCGYASGERNVIVPRADAPGGTEPTWSPHGAHIIIIVNAGRQTGIGQPMRRAIPVTGGAFPNVIE